MTGESALREAKAADKRRRYAEPLGVLDGIPIAVKDIIDTRGAACKAGLNHLAAYRPTDDADVVQRLRDAGAVIMGVTETDSGAFGIRTLQSTNPTDQRRICGGSSGGSAAAVASGMVFGALGTDTGGSVRIPAACCSIAGFKPTWGRVSTRGVRPLAATLDHVGTFARSVQDLIALQSTIDPEYDRDAGLASSAQGLRVGIATNYVADASECVRSAIRSAIEVVGVYDHQVMPQVLPDIDDVLRCHLVNAPKEAADYHLTTFPSNWSDYPDVAQLTIDLGRGCTDEDYAAAQHQRARFRETVDCLMEKVDVLLLPTLPMDAPYREDETVTVDGQAISTLEAVIRYTALFNQTGHPVVSVPAYRLDDGRAISVQLVGARDSDRRLLDIAAHLEAAWSVDIDLRSLTENNMSSSAIVMTGRNRT